MRTLILHLTNGETKEWETNFGGNGSTLSANSIVYCTQQTGWGDKSAIVTTPTFALCTDGSFVGLNNVVWMEEKKV